MSDEAAAAIRHAACDNTRTESLPATRRSEENVHDPLFPQLWNFSLLPDSGRHEAAYGTNAVPMWNIAGIFSEGPAASGIIVIFVDTNQVPHNLLETCGRRAFRGGKIDERQQHGQGTHGLQPDR